MDFNGKSANNKCPSVSWDAVQEGSTQMTYNQMSHIHVSAGLSVTLFPTYTTTAAQVVTNRNIFIHLWVTLPWLNEGGLCFQGNHHFDRRLSWWAVPRQVKRLQRTHSNVCVVLTQCHYKWGSPLKSLLGINQGWTCVCESIYVWEGARKMIYVLIRAAVNWRPHRTHWT